MANDTVLNPLETAEAVTEEYVNKGGTDQDELFDLIEAAIPHEADPYCLSFTAAERAFTRLTGLEFTEDGQPDWEKRRSQPGPLRVMSLDRTKPPFIIPRKDNNRHFGYWFPRGTVSLAAGASGTGKTVLLAHLLENLRQGIPVLQHPAAIGEYRFLLVDRTRKELRESIEDKDLATEEVMSRAYEVDFLDDSRKPAQILDGALKTWESEGTVPDVVIVEGADMWCGEAADLRKTVHFLKSLIQVATAWNVAVVASVGSPKQKPKEQYAMTRDKVFGSIGWGRTCSTILHISLTAPENPDSVRKVQVLPRTGCSETFHFEFRGGLLTFCEAPTEKPESQPQPKRKDTQSEMISLLETLPKGTVLTAQTFPWLSKAAVFKNLKELSKTGWVAKNDDGKWVVPERQHV